jgi:hypothetical protein
MQPQNIAVAAEEAGLSKPIVEEEAVAASSFASVLAGEMPTVGSDDEVRMLEGIRERLLVLFEGFQSPNNVNIEAKVDLTLNFFEYLLATIDNRLDTIRL